MVPYTWSRSVLLKFCQSTTYAKVPKNSYHFLFSCLSISSFRWKSLIHFQPSFAQSGRQESSLIHLQMYFQSFQQYLLSRLSLCHSVLCSVWKKKVESNHYFVSLLLVPLFCSISLSSCFYGSPKLQQFFCMCFPKAEITDV